MATHHRHLPKKPPRCSSHQCPVNFQKYWNKTSVVIQTSFSHYINIWLVKIEKFVKNRNIWQSAKRITHTEEHTQRSKCVKFQDSYFENQPQECQNVTIEFCFTMRIFYELRYTVIIEIVWTFYLKSVPAKFQKYFKLISWVISGTNSSKLSRNPRHPSRNISCNHRHHLLQPSWRRIFSTSNNQKTRVDSDINIDYKAFSFEKLYIWRRQWDTAGFVRAHQRKYWNALTVGRGHADDGYSCNHRAVLPSENGRWHCSRGRVVKAMDSKSIGLCPHRFESCRLRKDFVILPKLE